MKLAPDGLIVKHIGPGLAYRHGKGPDRSQPPLDSPSCRPQRCVTMLSTRGSAIPGASLERIGVHLHHSGRCSATSPIGSRMKPAPLPKAALRSCCAICSRAVCTWPPAGLTQKSGLGPRSVSWSDVSKSISPYLGPWAGMQTRPTYHLSPSKTMTGFQIDGSLRLMLKCSIFRDARGDSTMARPSLT